MVLHSGLSGVVSFLLLALVSAGVVSAAPVPSSNPFSGDAEAIEKGHQLYRQFCSACHGEKADGLSPRWGRYAADLRRFWRGYSEFLRIVAGGRPERGMPPWGGVLTEEEIAYVGAYLETLALPGARWTD